jgi:hypothetical protein
MSSSTAARRNLRRHLETSGLLLCNENPFLPSLQDAGGDWNAIVGLLEAGEAFHCKVFRQRTTYLAPSLYVMLKPHRQREERLTAESREIYECLHTEGPTDTVTLKRVLRMPPRIYTKAFDLLLREMLVTVVARNRDLTADWSSFVWGTFREWERRFPPPPAPEGERWKGLVDLCLGTRKVLSLPGASTSRFERNG